MDFNRSADISSELGSSDVDFQSLQEAGNDVKFQMVPGGILIKDTVNSERNVALSLWNDGANASEVTLTLTTNVIHEMNVRKIFQTGTENVNIIVFGNSL